MVLFPFYTIFTILYLVLAHHYARKKPLLCCSHRGMCQSKIRSGIWGYLNEPAHKPFDILTQLQRPPISLRRLKQDVMILWYFLFSCFNFTCHGRTSGSSKECRNLPTLLISSSMQTIAVYEKIMQTGSHR